MKYKLERTLIGHELDLFEGMEPLLAGLFFHRGIKNIEQAKRFMNPDYDRDVLDPFLLKGAEKASSRVISAIKGNEKIIIYSDYDADGIPGAAMFHDFFTKIGYQNFRVYIPHRHNEGFGFSVDAVRELSKEGVDLIITLDCGITDCLAVEEAKKCGIEVIIIDHHEPFEVLPDAFAIIDHKQEDCPYPDKNLCGTGVGYKLIQAIISKERFGLGEGQEKWLLDLVGIATLSDMVSLTGENRALAYYGLLVLKKTRREGLKALMEKIKVNRHTLTEDDVAFSITPRINAASRMGKPMDAFSMLSATDRKEAELYADHLNEINDERKGVVASLVKEVKKELKERHQGRVPNVIVLGNPEWKPSLLGLVANTCVQEYGCPVFLWGRDGENVIKGSCRSVGATHVVDIMKSVSKGVLTHYGGHRNSGGFAVHNDHIHYLEEKLNDAFLISSVIRNESDIDESVLDAEITMDDVNEKMSDLVGLLAPFGTGNRKPKFLIKNIQISDMRKFGKKTNHVELKIENSKGKKISAIAFFGSEKDWATKVEKGSVIDLVGSIEKSFYGNKKEIRLRIDDVIYS